MSWTADVYQLLDTNYFNVYPPPSPYHSYIATTWVPSPYWWYSTSGAPCSLSLMFSVSSTGTPCCPPMGYIQLPIQLPSNWVLFNTDWSAYVIRGTVNFPQTGTYTFKVWADELVQVYIDGALVFDYYVGKDCCPSGVSFTANITAGPHEVMYKYLQKTGASGLIVQATLPDGTTKCPFPL